MRGLILAYAIGIALGVILPTLPLLSLEFLTLFIANTLATCLCRKSVRLRRVFAVLTCLLAGLSWHSQWASQQLAAQLPSALEGEDLSVSGRIVSLPDAAGNRQRFVFRVGSGPESLVGQRLQLSDYSERELKGGQCWRWTLRLKRPHGLSNPGGRDSEARFLQESIVAQGYVRPGVATSLRCPWPSLTAIRQILRDRVLSLPGARQHDGILLALILGDRAGLEQDQWELFGRTGTSHLFVISGLHVGLVALGCALLITWLLRLTPVVVSLPVRQIAAVVAIVAAVIYSMLAGFTLPTQRALIMIVIFMSARLLRRQSCQLLRLLIALAVVLSLDPLAITSPGFWLSFSAVGGLILFTSARASTLGAADKNRWSLVRNWLLPQWVVFIVLLAPLLFWTGQVALLSPLINTAAIPFVGMFVVPLALAGGLLSLLVPELAQLLLSAADFLLVILLRVLSMCSELGSWSRLQTYPGTAAAAVLTITCALLLVLPARLGCRWLCLLLLLPLFLPRAKPVNAGELAVHVFDVGQGLSVLLRTKAHSLLYDTGAAFEGGLDLAESQVLPALAALGLERLDALVLSHGDNDHAGGAASILTRLQVDRWFSPVPMQVLDRESKNCHRGQNWEWDGVRFQVLWPNQGEAVNLSSNNRSCVLRISAAGQSIILAGDIEASVERGLAGELREQLASTILLVPHHGSNTSSGYPFLKTVSPEIALVSAGYRNGFGHPAAAVRRRYEDLGIKLLNTASQGRIRLVLSGQHEATIPVAFRSEHRRYWHWSENRD